MKYFLILLFITIISSAVSASSFLPMSFKANVEQVITSAISGKLKKSNGTIEYMYPSNFRFELKGKDNILMVSNAKTSWLYRPPFFKDSPGDVVVSNTSNLQISRLFDALRHGLKTNRVYDVKKTKKNVYKITIKKNHQKSIGLNGAEMSFKNPAKPQFKELEVIHIVHLDNKKVRFNFANVELNAKFKKGRFVFKIPPNTKISK